MGAGHLIHYIHALKLFKIISKRVRTDFYTSKDISSLKKHRNTSSALNFSNSIPTKITLKGKINVYHVLHMLGNVWAVGEHTCGYIMG